jgi:hypothetical protein
MISRYDDFIAACKAHEVCREEASATGAVRDLQQWHTRWPNENDKRYIWEIRDSEFEQHLLPLTG